MKEEKFNQELINFITNATCAFTTIKELKKELEAKNYTYLEETDKWDLKKGNYFTIRNDATLIAFHIPKNFINAFNICTTHCDNPSLALKPNGQYTKNDYVKYNIMPYGGLLNYAFLDRPLSLAGRIIIEKNNTFQKQIIDLKEPIAIIPSVAIHQNAKANTNLDINMQTDMQPILSVNTKANLNDFLKKSLTIDGQIKDYDLFFYNCEKPCQIGYQKELLASPRIDNLTSVFAGFKAFLKAKSNAISVYVSFNNEEIGSLTKEGAESSFLLDILKRIATCLNLDLAKTLANSFIVSCDNTHAIHPNHPEYMDDTGNLKLNQGLAIIKEINSTTDGYFSSIFKKICDKCGSSYQDATIKNDCQSGSTLSGLSLRHVSISSIDIGISQLAMHSSYELCGLKDITYLYKALELFYQTDIIIDQKKTKLIFH